MRCSTTTSAAFSAACTSLCQTAKVASSGKGQVFALKSLHLQLETRSLPSVHRFGQAFGTVYLMQNPHDHQLYAVKELTNLTNEDGSTDRAAMNELIGEVRKMGAVSSEFVVRYHTSAIYDGRFYVMMDPIKGAEYRDAVVARQNTGEPFTAAQLKSWVGKIAQGLAHLHDKCKLVHQDLHNGNVMITGIEKGPKDDLIVSDEALIHTSIKILDLGLASFKSDHEHGGAAMRTMRMRTVRMAPGGGGNGRHSSCILVDAEDLGGFKAIRAPEMQPDAHVRGQVRFNAKTDVWALGILLIEAALLLPIEL